MVCLVIVKDYLMKQKIVSCKRSPLTKKRLSLVGGLGHLVSWVICILIWENMRELKLIIKKEFRPWSVPDYTLSGSTCGRYL